MEDFLLLSIYQSRRRFLTAEQARLFLDSVAGDRQEALYTLALQTGMRQII
jgi:hypothetical protein